MYDMERVHDRPRAGDFFAGALKPGESIHRDDLDALTPRIGVVGQPGFEDMLGAGRDYVQDDGDVPVPIRGVSLHVFIHADDAQAVEPSWIIDQ